LFDEREYYLGELSRIVGCCLRLLTRRDDAREWLDRAESRFLLTANSAADVARVSYQRLALYLEERKLSVVLELAEPLAESFERTGARESALKCRYAKAAALRELGRLPEALEEFQGLSGEARKLKSSKLLGPVFVALVQTYAEVGESEAAIRVLAEAEPYLRAEDNRVSLGKLYWGLGMLLRHQGKLSESVGAFRAAQQELLAIEMKADVAALHLVIADLLMEIGQERQAEWEIRAALPVIDELKMVPEGFAAMTLLRESLRRRSIDRQALRKLHGYFEEAGA
jgi:tetratricopeptide (TPR) repeat protein